jgi:hypothetical protein
MKSLEIYRAIVSLKRTTTGTVIYGNHDLRGQYIPKELLKAVSGRDEEYPQELIFIIRTTSRRSLKADVPKKRATERPGSRPQR